MSEPIYDLTEIIPSKPSTFLAIGFFMGMVVGVPASLTILVLVEYVFK